MGKTDYRAMIEKEFLGQWDLEGHGDVIVQIESVERYAPPRQRTKKVDGKEVPEANKRIVVRFVGKKKSWLAGPVSQKTIAGMYGRYVEDWKGKRITLYVDPSVRFGNEVTGGIRVRNTIPKLGERSASAPLDAPVDQAKSEQLRRAADDAAKE